MARPNIAFVESSLADGSFEGKIAREAIAALGDRVDVTVVDYRDLPLLSDDNAFPAPDAALAIRDKFQNADAVWVFTTEYHHSLPVAVKNLFDWLTSPKAAEDKSDRTVLENKPVAITGVGGFKGMFGRIELGDLLEANGMRVFPVEVGLSVPETAFETGEWVMTEGDIQAIEMQANDFLTFVNANDDHEEK
ncbi:NADPH-dependent FMN reductase [Bifidobacterium choloepi]|uniref:NAD(P)H-dependent oxidoreductase n=1 Tax=Bifidobacterium choloepi TaxID=2614131 RepID=A0A6I5N9G7_9BIFI|nr:NADPH-dependent FMN reductase [Bifidobacterium choloepi]NEG70441.1 NAD(P)H-dependent oxidoreductase [Bifidobacterium choloepi]